MRIRDTAIQDMHDYFEAVTAKAYRHLCLVADPVLARSPSAGFVRRVLDDDTPRPVTVVRVAKRLVGYFIGVAREVRSFVHRRRLHRISGQHHEPSGEHLVVLDTIYYAHKVVHSGSASLINFPGLDGKLREAGYSCLIAPEIYGKLPPAEFARFFDILRRHDTPVVTQFQLITNLDLLRLLWLCFVYPLTLLAFFGRGGGSQRDRLLRCECLERLSSGVVNVFLRNLYGRRLARLGPSRITVISWCENRAGDKLFYHGLRQGPARVDIVGARLFIFPERYLGCYINRAEASLGFAPDRLVANGPHYCCEFEPVPATVGPSLRYLPLFSFHPLAGEHRDILLLMPHDERAASNMLLAVAELAEHHFLVLFHPSHTLEQWLPQLPPHVSPAAGDLYQSLAGAGAVVGTESGSLVEALACGVPVVNVDALGRSTLGYLPDLGRDVVWFDARTPEELRSALRKARSVPEATLKDYARRYRENFFREPLPGGFLEPFGL